MADVAVREALPVDADVAAEGDDFEQLAHFVRHQQFVQGTGRLNIGGGVVRQAVAGQFGDAEVEQEIRPAWCSR